MGEGDGDDSRLCRSAADGMKPDEDADDDDDDEDEDE